MTRYSVQPRVRMFEKGYEFLDFAKKIDRNISKVINKNLSCK